MKAREEAHADQALFIHRREAASQGSARQLVERQARAWEKQDFTLAAADWLPTAVLSSPEGNTPAPEMPASILRHIGRRGQKIIEKPRAQPISGVVVKNLFKEHASQTLGNPSVNLALHHHRIDHHPAVVDRSELRDPQFARLRWNQRVSQQAASGPSLYPRVEESRAEDCSVSIAVKEVNLYAGVHLIGRDPPGFAASHP